jgi:4a-hydroxytetrahydrobiopterin dehydratase
MMDTLVQMKCVACRRGAPTVTEAEIVELLPQLPAWQIIEQEGVSRLERHYKFPDFASALAFTNRIGAMAEDEGHHPLIITEWGNVKIQWWTHKIRGLHKNDFIAAAKSDTLYPTS